MTDQFDRLTSALADRYTIERDLGAGGMATVYLAEDLKHHRKVAVKVLRPELAAVLGAERFVHEIQVTANLQHPHILPLFDSGDTDGFLYYVMPLVEGESLADKLERERQLPIDESIDITRQVAAALEYAHARGVVHRDIKPDNIMLSSGEAIVADFGIARAVDFAGGEQLTATGVAIGTPAYMSPEQAAGDREIDARSDVYALGCVLFEMLAGQTPFTGPTAQSVIAQRLAESPPSVRTFRDGLPDSFVTAVSRSLARAPVDRFDSAASFGAALQAPPTSENRGRQRNRLGWAAVAGLVVLASGWLGLQFVGPGMRTDLRPTVVVGVFSNETGEDDLAHIGTMAQDWLIQGMLRANVLPVVATPTARQAAAAVSERVAADAGMDPVEALADVTGATLVVSGRYYREGDNIRFQAELTDVDRIRETAVLDPVIVPDDSIMLALGELRSRLMSALSLTVDDRMTGMVSARSPPTQEAYVAFDQGMDHYSRFEPRAAYPYFIRAFQLDSSYTPSLVFASASAYNMNARRLADSTLDILERHREDLNEHDRLWLDGLRAMVEGAEEDAVRYFGDLNRLVPGTRATHVYAVNLRRTGRAREALEVLATIPDGGPLTEYPPYWNQKVFSHHHLGEDERALAVARESATRGIPGALQREIVILAALGRGGEVDSLLDEESHVLSLVDQFNLRRDAWREFRAHGHGEAMRGSMGQALRWFDERSPEEQTLEDPDGWSDFLAEALAGVGRASEAIEVIDALERVAPPTHAYVWVLVGSFSGLVGDSARAAAAAERLLLEAGDASYWTLQRSQILAGIGRFDEAFEALRQAIRGGQAHPSFHRVVTPEWRRADPRVEALLRPIG